ncbi:MAG TPA: MerR family transcriptional regulator [Acidimicrobiales bacterium]|nr:MerR family transcriptional regulator [Acidimicrobiales bacterium]
MSKYRVEELAAVAGVSVEALRSYQSKGLLPPPRHEGRVALYGDQHVERLRLIRDLKTRGHSLRAIASLLEQGPTGDPRRPFADAVIATEHETLTLAELSERTGVPPALLRSLEGSGILQPHKTGEERRYTPEDVRAVRMVLTLLGSGVPIEEFVRVARVQLEAADELAQDTVELFLQYVREPLLASGMPKREEAERMVAAFRLTIQAATELISYTFQRTLLRALQQELDRTGSRSERAALRKVVERRLQLATPA